MFSCAKQLDSDKYFDDRITIEKVFRDKTLIRGWLANAYFYMNGENREVNSKNSDANPFCFADDIYYGDRDVAIDAGKDELSYNMFKLGTYDENRWLTGAWGAAYKGIYQASIFIHNIDQCPESVMEGWEKQDSKGQARFVRAYLYWMLLRRYGPVPIMPDQGVDYTLSYAEIATPRSSYEEVAEYISNEMLQAARELYYTTNEGDGFRTSRATIGAALATRAYALIFAASPFANGNDDAYAQQLVDDAGRRLLSAQYSEEKWARAAAACKDVINLRAYELSTFPNSTNANEFGHSMPTVIPAATGSEFASKNWPNGWANIDPRRSYQRMFNGELDPSQNKELIFSRGATDIVAMVDHQMPKDYGGWNCHGMTQKMVDAYYMNDGTDAPGKDREIGRNADGTVRLTGFTTEADIRAGTYPELGGLRQAIADNKTDNDKKIGVGVSKQYVNREPRFYASVAYSGTSWGFTSQSVESNRRNAQVFYYFGTPNGYRNDGFYLRTGIGIKKFVDPGDYPGNYKLKPETAIRYADILLLYAEALNELQGSYTISSWNGATEYTIARDVVEMKIGIHPVRIRAGLPDYSAAIYADADLMRSTLKRERQIELMGEGKRYFDIRRWKDAPAEESLLIYGCNVYMPEANREQFHQPIAIPNLPSTFSDKLWLWPIKHSELQRNRRLTQNPGWQLP
jgi:hypothetical protein